MFRTIMCSSSGRLIRVILCYFFVYPCMQAGRCQDVFRHVLKSAVLTHAGWGCHDVFKHTLTSTRLHIWMHEKYHKSACINIPEEGHLVVRNMSKTLQLNEIINEKKCSFCWFLQHMYITMRGPGSSVSIATDYGLDGPGSNPGGDEIFRRSRPTLGPTQLPVQCVPGLSRG